MSDDRHHQCQRTTPRFTECVAALGLVSAFACGDPGAEGSLRAAKATPQREKTPPTPTEPVTQPEAGKGAVTADIPGARILSEEISDTPIKTAVDLRIEVPRSTTKAQLDAYLPWLYSQQMSRTGFEQRTNPNSVYAFIFREGFDWKNNPGGWIARVAKAAADTDPTFDNKALEGKLLDQVKEALGEENVEATTDGVHVTYILDGGVLIDANSKPREVSDSMMFAAFFMAGTVYSKVADVDQFVGTYTYEGKPIGEIRFTRATYEGLNYDAAMEDVAKVEDAAMSALLAGKLTADQADARVKKAQRVAYRKLLKKLPKDAVKIDKKFRP